MTFYGQYINGVIVLRDPMELPEGTLVKVEPVSSAAQGKNGPSRKWKGIYRNDGPVPTEEDIRQMRQEAWPE
jgi:hypothetical protein